MTPPTDVRDVGRTGRCDFDVITPEMNVPAAFTVKAMAARQRAAVRFAGGCKGMSPADKLDMAKFIMEAFRGYQGVATSGATSARKDGKAISRNDVAEVDLMVTDLAVLVDSDVALGTAPRTGQMYFAGFGLLNLDQYGTNPNLRMDHILIVEDSNADTTFDWDGDLDHYFRWMTMLHREAGFRLGLVVWNGGAVTLKEALEAARLGWQVIVITGTGRAADELATSAEYTAFRALDNVSYVGKSDPIALRAKLVKAGFLK